MNILRQIVEIQDNKGKLLIKEEGHMVLIFINGTIVERFLCELILIEDLVRLTSHHAPPVTKYFDLKKPNSIQGIQQLLTQLMQMYEHVDINYKILSGITHE